MKTGPLFLLALSLALALVQPSCNCRPSSDRINLDGSSTVYVISEAVAEEYQKLHQGRISISISGTGGGFKKLCSGRVNIIGASRPINKSELQLCASNGIKPTEFPIALDGIIVAVNPRNTWIKEIDLHTLKTLFEPEAEGKILKWKNLNPGWPDRKIALFVPGISSGTFDYFTKAVVGTERSSRGDLTSSEDDNVLVHGVRSNLDGIGFFSFAYYAENSSELKAVPVINSNGHAIMPTRESIQNGTYEPLSRPIFIYADQEKALPFEQKFLAFYLENAASLAADVGFIALRPEADKD